MRRMQILVILALLAACDERQAAFEDPQSDPVIISVVGTNDFHGRIVPGENIGGLPLLSAYLNNLREARMADGAVVLVDAGDIYQGTVESTLGEGRETILAFNALAYDAAAIGNHEFDFGPIGPAATAESPDQDSRGAVKARAIDAKFPMLAANLIDLQTNAPVAWENVTPSIILDKAGIKIGLVGVTTSETLRTTIAANMNGLGIRPLRETVVQQATQLRERGADVVIVAAHAGGQCATFDDPQDLSSCDTDAEIFVLANELPPGLVDVIVAGHVHAGIAHFVNGIAVISSFSNGEAFGRVDLVLRPDSGMPALAKIFRPQLLQISAADFYEGRPLNVDPAITVIFAPAVARADTLRSTPLDVTLATPIRKTVSGVSPLGELVVAALVESSTDADIVLLNASGFINADLPAGALTYGAMFEMLPFDNLAVTLQLSAADVKKVLSEDLQRSPRILSVGGARLVARCEDGVIAVELLRVDGGQISDDAMLTVMTTDFLAGGGDAALLSITPSDGFEFSRASPVVRDVVINWLQQRPEEIREDRYLAAASQRALPPGTGSLKCNRGRPAQPPVGEAQ